MEGVQQIHLAVLASQSQRPAEKVPTSNSHRRGLLNDLLTDPSNYNIL